MIKTVHQKRYRDIHQSGYCPPPPPPVWKRAQVQGLKESRGEAIKIITQTCKVIKNSTSKKDIETSTRVAMPPPPPRLVASPGPRTKGVPTYNQSGRGSGPCLLWGGLDKSRHIVPTTLLVKVQCFMKNLYKAVEGPSTRPIHTVKSTVRRNSFLNTSTAVSETMTKWK